MLLLFGKCLIRTALLSCSPLREAAISSCHRHEAADVFLLLLSGRESGNLHGEKEFLEVVCLTFL